MAVVQLLPAAVVAPFAATIGMRFARDRALAAAYALVAVTMAATGVAMAVDAGPLVVYPLAVLAQCSLTTVRPLQAAIVPGLVGTAEQLTAANALSMVLEGIGSLLGPLLVGVILAVASPGVAVLLAGLASAAGAVLVLGVALSAPTAALPPRAGSVLASLGADGEDPGLDGHPEPVEVIHRAELRLLDGLRAVRRSPSGMLVIGLIGSREVIAGALDVLLVIAAIEMLGMGESGAGYLSAAVGAGAVLGGASTLALAGRARIAPFLLAGAVGWGVFLVLIPVIPSPYAAATLLVAAGVGLAVLQVTARTLLQRLMPVDALAGAFGVLEGFIFGGLAIGAMIAGPLVAAVGLPISIVLLGLLMPIVTIVVLPSVARGERTVHIPLREIALLRRLRLFAPVAAPAVEAAARRLIPVRVAAGQPVIRQGEVGDRFYVIVEGVAAVRQEDRELRLLGPGDAFGEIALLRRIPRTATVVAIEPLELRALERDDFLLAITGTPQAIEEARRAADAHLEMDAARARSPA